MRSHLYLVRVTNALLSGARIYTLMNDECEKRIERRRVLLEKKNDRGAFSFAFQLQLWHAVKRILYSMILSCTVNIII